MPMNDDLIKRSIKAFIETYAEELLEDLESGNRPKLIQQISTAKGTPMRGGISIWVIITSSMEYYDASKAGTAISYSWVTSKLEPRARYEVELHVADFAIREVDELPLEDYDAYMKSTATFDVFCARLIDAFRKYITIPPIEGSFRIEVYGDGGTEDRSISVRDQSGPEQADESGNSFVPLYKIIVFRVETCGEPTPLDRS